jgi:tetrapyrrole methylase family protein / MazG family protein
MDGDFDKFMILVEKSIEKDPWVKDKTVKGYCEEIINESNEAIEAIGKKDNHNLKEELADIFNDWAHACKLGEEEGLFTMKEILAAADKKLSWRKPYLHDKESKKMTKEETVRIWFEQKAKEKR